VEGSGLLAGFSTYLLPEAAWLRQAVLGRLGQEWATPQTRRAVLESVEKLDFPSRMSGVVSSRGPGADSCPSDFTGRNRQTAPAVQSGEWPPRLSRDRVALRWSR
jgi:hypothetical protein